MTENNIPHDPQGRPVVQPVTATSRPGILGLLKKPAPTREAPQAPVDSVREIVETVVFVVVLVLLLKSFVAEAFVIPTGSMAETLLGNQKFISCPECDFLFPVDASEEVDPSFGEPQRVAACSCPNCRKRIDLATPPWLRKPGSRPDPVGAIPDPGPTSGDRVLVAKFLYDLFAALPHRFDVVVFRYPGYSVDKAGPADLRPDPLFPATGPYKAHVPINYIKRLIGLPGETVAICNGKLYVLPAEKGPRYDDLQKARTGEERTMEEALLWRKPHMHIDDRAAVELFSKGQFQILRKSPENILAMKRLVYDNDHRARDLDKDPAARRWRAENDKAWADNGATGFQHKATAEEPLSWVRYHHRLRDRREDAVITPFMGYNTGRSEPLSKDWVGDLILECELAADKAEGEFVMELSKGPIASRPSGTWPTGSVPCSASRRRRTPREFTRSSWSARKPR